MADNDDYAPELFPELQEVEGPPSRGHWTYGRKPATTQGNDEGWIVQLPITPSLKADYEGRGFKYLSEYGIYKNGTRSPGARAQERDVKGVPWNPANEPWRMILQKGGAKEFPLSQIVAYNWHVRPPYRGVDFPQLQESKAKLITTYQCPECEGTRYLSAQNPREAAAYLRRHLTSKVNDRHSYTVADLTSLGKEYGIDFSIGRVGNINPVVMTPSNGHVPEPVAEAEPLNLTPEGQEIPILPPKPRNRGGRPRGKAKARK